MDPFFSIVIPTYNRAHLLDKTIDTTLSQTFGDFELLVVDDGSTDDTEAVVRSCMSRSAARITYIRQVNSERAAARNNGLRHAAGQYVIFLDSDDTLYPNHLEVARNYISENGQPEFMHLRYDIKNGAGTVTREAPVYQQPPNKDIIFGNFLSCNGIFIRRDVALQNPFNEDRKLSAMEDWELWLRLCSKYPLHYVNTITSSIINHEERSVVVTRKEALVDRAEAMIRYVTENPQVSRYYQKSLAQFRSSCYSYVSLHLALTGRYRSASLRFLIKSFRHWPGFILQRRFFAILKHLI